MKHTELTKFSINDLYDKLKDLNSKNSVYDEQLSALNTRLNASRHSVLISTLENDDNMMEPKIPNRNEEVKTNEDYHI